MGRALKGRGCLMPSIKGVIQREGEEEEVLDVELERDVLEQNRRLADENNKLLKEKGVMAIDVLGSVGSGKTSLIERLVDALKPSYKVAVIEGDVATTIDSERVASHGVSVVQVNTGKECHLDALLIRKAIEKLDLSSIDILFIENVGNLICPADFPLGSDLRIVIVSVTEGPHMVVKHPFIFAEADVVVINKLDLADLMGVDVDRIEEDVRRISPRPKVVRTSCRTGEGVQEVIRALGLR